MNKPHHRGTFQRRADKIRAAAYADPYTKCWRCGRTLAQHPRHKTGRPPTWQAGHVLTGVVDGPLAPEASTCNTTHGGRLGGQRAAANKRARRNTATRSQAW